MSFEDLYCIALTMLLGEEYEWWFDFTPHSNYWKWKLQQAIN